MPDVNLAWHSGTATLVIDRPGAANAFSLGTMDAFESALDEACSARPRCVILRGGGERVFVSGGDVKELAALREPSETARMAHRMRSLLDRIAKLPVPTIAVVNGHALGGGAEVAIACDFRIAASHAVIAFNQSTLAIMPAWGGVERLVDLVGRNQALRLLLTGRRLDAIEARNMGLVDDVVEIDELDQYCAEFVTALTAAPRSVVTQIKHVVDAVQSNTHPDTRDLAVEAFTDVWTAQDHWDAVEVMTAAQAARRLKAHS